MMAIKLGLSLSNLELSDARMMTLQLLMHECMI